MILTCPECSTSYFVDDAKIPEDGRVVKCVSCGHRWTARREVELELTAPAPKAEPPVADTAPAAVDQAAAEPETESAPREGLALPKAFRAKAHDSRRMREAATTGVVWAGMAAALAVMIAVAVVFRVDVVRLWPSTAGAFAGVGLPVNSVGLAIEGVEFEPALQDGHAALSVSGMIRNIEDRTITAPPLQIRLLNKAGKPVATKIARPADPEIPPGETRHFALALIDPPGSAAEIEVTFAQVKAPAEPKHPETLDLRGAAEASAPAHAEAAAHGEEAHAPVDHAAAAAHGPAVQEAKPLPMDDHGEDHHD